MKTVKKNVYYCDFCGKRSLAALHMHNHEDGCTMNPNRKCGLCDGRDIVMFIEQLKSRFEIKEIELNDCGNTLEVVYR